MNRGAYIIKRLGLAVPVMMFGITMSFLILYLGPIDPSGASSVSRRHPRTSDSSGWN